MAIAPELEAGRFSNQLVSMFSKGLGGSMELRRLRKPIHIEQFRKGLAYARQKAIGFRETKVSRVGEIHLRFGMVYGLYATPSDTEGTDNPMLGGITLHSRADYELTHPVSALNGLPPSTVFEGTQLWSSCHAAAVGLRAGFMLLAALHGARALVAFPVISPRDVSVLHRQFQRIGCPFQIPFVTTVNGEEVWAQTMVLQGASLDEALHRVCARGFSTRNAHTSVRFSAALELAISRREVIKEENLIEQRIAYRPVGEAVLSATL